MRKWQIVLYGWVASPGLGLLQEESEQVVGLGSQSPEVLKSSNGTRLKES